jgi:hypothetical protein
LKLEGCSSWTGAVEVSAELFAAEIDGITSGFMKKYMDHEIEEEIRRGLPMDLHRLSCFGTVLHKAAKSLAAERAARDFELAERLSAASLDQLIAHIDHDSEQVRRHRKEHAMHCRAKELQIVAYKTKRYETGLQRVAEKMENSLSLHLGSPSEFPQFLGQMKAKMAQLQRHPDDA